MISKACDLQGRCAVVTGAGKGIGRAVCLALAEAGADVLAFSRTAEDLSALGQEIEALGRRFVGVVGDVASASDVGAMAARVSTELGGADILVNNAGVVYAEPALDTTPEHWSETLAVNLTGAFLCAQALAPHMLERRWGRIVNISAQSGVVGAPEHAAYCASKGGLNALTRVLAVEWGPFGVTVNAIAPTVILTPMGQKVWGDPAKGDPMRARIPIGRFGEPHEVAAAVVYLASEAASLVNGHIMMLDGGFTAQ
jgi:NAD(P)-dependent dehydrogenase (short-subunit alcohol dehydrogenase family)